MACDVLTDARVVVHDSENPITSLLHVGVGADAAEEWRKPKTGPGLAAGFPGVSRNITISKFPL